MISKLIKKIVETDASDIGYGGILKQLHNNKECIVQFTSGHWNKAEKNYSTIKKEILSIVKCISKFQSDLLNQFFFLELIVNLQKKFYKKMFKTLHQNRFLLDGKQS